MAREVNNLAREVYNLTREVYNLASEIYNMARISWPDTIPQRSTIWPGWAQIFDQRTLILSIITQVRLREIWLNIESGFPRNHSLDDNM